MKPIEPPGDYGTYLEIAKSQDEYNTLVARYDKASGVITTLWELDDNEKRLIANGHPVHLEIMTFGHALQPLLIYVEGNEPSDKDGSL